MVPSGRFADGSEEVVRRTAVPPLRSYGTLVGMTREEGAAGLESSADGRNTQQWCKEL
jgi:hypothetical protein